jgi:two-component system, NtrC family, C4-dicarboxylate transport sensor histidine kinase DctB
MIAIPRPLRLTFYSLLIIAGAVLAAALAMRQAERQSLVDDAGRANQQLALYANSLHTLIERYRALPAVLALDSEMINALARSAGSGDPGRAQPQTGTHQRRRAVVDPGTDGQHRAGRGGQQLERLPSSYVGHNYAFRPYFSQTRSQGTGRFYAVGVTTGHSGVFPVQRSAG